MVGTLNTKLKTLKPPALSPPKAVQGAVSTHRPSAKLTRRALGVTPQADGPPGAWVNGGVLRRTIWGCTCLCMCLCVARGDQGTILACDRTGWTSYPGCWRDPLSTYICVYGCIFCPVRDKTKPDRREQDVFPQGTCTLSISQLVPQTWSCGSITSVKEMNLSPPCSLCLLKQRGAFTDRW